MNKNSVFAFIMIIAISITMFTGCGNDIPVNDNSNTNTEELKVGDLNVEVLSCEFDKEVMGIDEEMSSWGFTERNGKVYVNLALKITNNGTTTFNKDNISAYFEYEELRYDLQYELMSVAPINNNDDSITQDCVGIVYMLTTVDEAATSEDITVYYTINGKEYKEKVKPIDTRSALEKKIKVSVGDKFNVNELYDVEVMECSVKKYLQTTNFADSEQYQSYGKNFVDLIIKVKNNTSVELKEGIQGYVLVGDGGSSASTDIEIDNNTDLKDLDLAPLKSNEEGIIHIYATVDENEATDGLGMRFNFAGNCYYCEAK
ncbi:MAG: hypothetical protein Q4B31_00360 [Clostridia bacterium]|nr:hypothetical protein [Clostridia bacterium]